MEASAVASSGANAVAAASGANAVVAASGANATAYAAANGSQPVAVASASGASSSACDSQPVARTRAALLLVVAPLRLRVAASHLWQQSRHEVEPAD